MHPNPSAPPPSLAHGQLLANAASDRRHNPTLPERHPYPHHATRLYGPLPHYAAETGQPPTPFIDDDHIASEADDTPGPPRPCAPSAVAAPTPG